jgi:glycosyltransferase involved in cell wall biosynthesis
MGLCASGMTRGEPMASVIIPTHNRAEMLRRAIASALAQTFTDIELIVVSDGSSDHTAEVVESFADPRLCFLRHDTARGASAARNTGLRQARGEFVAFLDDDDEWLPEKLALQVPVLAAAAPEVGLVYCWIEYVQDGAVVERRCPILKGDIFRQMLDRQAITNSSALLVRREAALRICGFDEQLPRGNDGDFIRRLCRHFQVEVIPQLLVRVHVGHPDRITVDNDLNLRNAARAYEARLTLFVGELEGLPEQKANILTRLAITYFQTGQWAEGVGALRRLMACPAPVFQRGGLLLQVLRRALGHYRRKLPPRPPVAMGRGA